MPQPNQPNIVLITTDQHRADHTSGYGFPLDTMPFLDELGSQGHRFHRAYTTYPACVPARTSILTGRFPISTRVRQNSTPEEVVRDQDILEVLGGAGYSLLFAGKPHMYRNEASDWDRYDAPYFHDSGPQPPPTDADARFEQWLKDLAHRVSDEPTPFELERQYCYRSTSSAIRFVEEAGDNPFFCWLSYPEPHNPYQAPDPYYSMFSPDEVPDRTSGPADALAKGGSYRWLRELIEEKRPGYDENWRRYRAVYCGMLRMLDDQVRRLVDELKRLGHWENTILIFTTDHGDYVAEYGLQRKGAGMSEALMRIPMVVTGPGVQPRDDRVNFCSLADLLPTICEAVGADIPLGVQGRSLWPLLTGAVVDGEEFVSVYAEHGFGGDKYEADERPELHFPYEGPNFDELNTVTQSGSTRMVRMGPYKLLFDHDGNGELYNVERDPAELNNLYGNTDLQAVQAEATTELLKWTIRVNDPLPEGVYTTKRHPHNWAREHPEKAADCC